MRHWLISIISGLALALPLTSNGQDSLTTKQDKFALDISVDYGKGIETLFQKQTKWEVGLGFVINKHYNFVGEYGFGSLNPESVILNGTYNAKGNYYRVGFEYVITVKHKRYISFGAMYANSNFVDQGVVRIESELWDSIEASFLRENLSANWAELIINTEGPVFKAEEGFITNFYWGMRLRMRILIADIEQPNFDIYAIPGYGRTYRTVVPAANFYIKYRIGF